jgi:hypothetical protein
VCGTTRLPPKYQRKRRTARKEPSLPPLKRIEVQIGVRKQGCMALIHIPACVLRKADDGVGVEWCEPLPFAVE